MESDEIMCKRKVYIIRDGNDNKILANSDDMLLCFPSHENAKRKLLKIKSVMALKIDQAIICFKSKRN